MKIKEIIKNKKILKKLKLAKQNYINNKCNCMCHALNIAGMTCCTNNEYLGIPICPKIPEYNREFLNAYYKNIYINSYWWYLDDKQSRINAFDKLIKVYKKKSRWKNLFIKPSVS